ncbi:N-acetylmuramic acid 6-phosphate etherase [Cohnella abietis]|uniref:N-acetylmuramic acid 6-phosphate etherase n=1 Tax=Cohnella abietis TaxID=2507935 RepID=A0A3T1DEF9_9BACL|nr:N-acetylmuramic acid 6-phosphate etherase [Cohnella abietis]BBI36482.1 N-acetylmuramic acid 6-phosphate etherase 2 [Cohnella abietis]
MDTLEHLVTEQRNERTLDLSELSIKEIIEIMNDEDGKVAGAVRQALPVIELVTAEIVKALEQGGRLIYIGAGTSGRLGVLDASECPPTFGVDYETVIALIAGGEGAFITAVEGAEDDEHQAAIDLQNKQLTEKDILIGLAASGRTPYVKGALQYAKQLGVVTAAVTCNRNSILSEYADLAIEVEVGPEVLTGSTRLKAATAQKMVLNMLTTAAMIKRGKVYQNLMIDLNVSNYKLRERAHSILMQATGTTAEEAEIKLVEAGNHVKTAIVMIEAGVSQSEASRYLEETNGFVTKAIAQARLELSR